MPLDELIDFYQTLTPASLARLDDYYAADARFKDPFNDVRGVPAIRRIFEHMYATLEAPHFMVSEKVGAGGTAFLVWTFRFRRNGAAFEIRGATQLRFDAAGKVVEHRDWWDAAEELYAKLPLLGPLMRWLQRRLAA
ncbi:MAG: nuclear transport factor 2 family protein [Rhodocyclaceae bacterium]|jgi:hypothetical protein|nr:nuclear transport factor 2 family protein [Rhodocyclaceae bacterium]